MSNMYLTPDLVVQIHFVNRQKKNITVAILILVFSI